MNRWFFSCLAGTLFLAEAAWAGEDGADLGRYRVIPNAMVPGKSGKLQEQAVLLDSATGRTWVVTPGAGKGPSPGPLWVPMEIKTEDPVEASAGSADTSSRRQQKDVKAPAAQRLKQNICNYDDNP